MTKVHALKNVCVSPYHFRLGVFHGGIEAEADCAAGRISGGAAAREASAPRVMTSHYLPGKALFAGPLWNHFGHILVDSLHRLWAVEDHDYIVFSGVIGLRGVSDQEGLNAWEPPQVLFDLLDMMGITTPIYIAREPVICRNLDVPEPGSVWKVGPSPWYFEHLQRYQERIAARVADLAAPEKLYYPRTHMLAEGGIVGTSYLENVIGASGVSIVQPEKLSLAQQFANLMKAKRVLFDEGSSVHLTELLARPGPAFYMLPRRTSDSVFARALRPRGPYAQLTPGSNVLMLPDRNGRENTTLSLCVYKDPDQVVSAIRKAGFISVETDMNDYRETERETLRKARANKPEIRETRMAALAALRA
jgi:hypothetical protein